MNTMNIAELSQFDLRLPGNWIEAVDRNWASENYLTITNITSLFEEAVAAFYKFDPMTYENYQNKMDEPPYIRRLNSIYAKAFVFALDGINKLIFKLCTFLQPPEPVLGLKAQYELSFGHLKHIRDSAIHIEDRGRGKGRNEKSLNTSIIILGSFNESRFGFTGEDGKHYEIEISDVTLHKAREIIQNIINSYKWF